jgi:hypothetical protein
MRRRWSWSLVLHVSLWAPLIFVFVWLAVPQVFPRIIEHRVGPVNPMHTFDHYLFGLGNGPEVSRQLGLLFSNLPKGRRVVIFVREKEEAAAFLGMAMAYLAWPNDIEVINCSEKEAAARLARIRPESVSALVFCKMKQPEWLAEGIRCGKDIRLICFSEPGQ